MDKKEEYTTKSQLKERGWTDTMIKKFLGTPDATKVNPFYSSAAPMGLYDVKRVKKVERTKAFKEAMEKSEARKAAAEKAVVTKMKKEMEKMEKDQQERRMVENAKKDLRKKLRGIVAREDIKEEGKLKEFLHDLAKMNGMLAKGWGMDKSMSDEACYKVKQECIDFLVKARPDRCFYAHDKSMYVVYVYAGGRQYSFHCYSLVNKPRFAPEFGVRWDGIVDGFKLSDEEYRLAVEKEQRRIKKKEKREQKKQKRFSNWMQKYVERNSIMSEDFYKNLEEIIRECEQHPYESTTEVDFEGVLYRVSNKNLGAWTDKEYDLMFHRQDERTESMCDLSKLDCFVYCDWGGYMYLAFS